MNKLFTLFILVFLLSCEAKVQDKKSSNDHIESKLAQNLPTPTKSSLNLEHLYGKVKRLVQTTSHAKRVGKKIVKVANGNKFIVIFDSAGNALEQHYYNSAGTEETRIQYEFNSQHKLKGGVAYAGTGKKLRILTIESNASNQIISEQSSSPNQTKLYTIQYFYQADGRLSTERKLQATGNAMTEIRHRYDNKGQCIETSFYNENNILTVRSSSTILKTDSKGNWLLSTEETNKGSLFLVERELEYY